MTPTTSLKGRSRHRWLLALGVLLLASVSGGLFGLHWWTRQQLRTAKNLISDLRVEEAGLLLEDYLRIRPSDAEAHLLAAQAKRRAGDAEAAEYHLNEFERLEGQTPASSLERVLLLAEHGALGDKESWLRSRLDEGDADRILLLEALTHDYLISRRFEEALEGLDHLIKARPSHPRALVWRAQIWRRHDNWDEALEDARLAVALRPGSVEARLIWAQVNEGAGQTEMAVREYGWLYDRGQKQSADVVLGLARCWQDLARFAQARQVLDAFLAEQPARADTVVERGRLALREGGTTLAEPYFRRAVALDPNHQDAHRLLLRCLEAGGKAEEAAWVDGKLRHLEIQAGRIAQLLSDVLAAPNDPEPRYRLGLLLLQNGREEEGRNALNDLLRLDPSHERARAALAPYSQGAGRRPGKGGRP
jgi:Tfp pilus assembly protein PilF